MIAKLRGHAPVRRPPNLTDCFHSPL